MGLFPVLGFLLHAWWTIGFVSLALFAGAALAFFRGWKTLAIVLAAVGLGNVYTGYVYQSGVAYCAERVKAEVEAEQARQAAIAERALNDLNARLAIAEGENIADDERIARYAADLAARPAVAACLLTDDDVRAINGR